MPNAKDFRRIVLGLEGAIESAHMGHPDFRVNGRIFATLQHDPRWAMVTLTPDQQQEFLCHDPVGFTTAAGAWGRGGCTLVHLETVDEETLGEAATLAWQNAVNQPAPAKKRPAKPARATPLRARAPRSPGKR